MKRTDVIDGLELGLAKIDELDPILRKLGNGLSEYNFSNLYLFRHTHGYHLVGGRYRFIAGTTYDGERHLMPLFELSDAPHGDLSKAIKGYDCFYPISEESLGKLKSYVFEICSHRDDSDYLYPADNFIHYRGRTLRKKRNLFHQYQRNGETEVFPLQGDNVGDAINILNEWQREKQKPRSETDYDACIEALKYQDRLNMEGFVHYRNEEATGFVLGKDIGGRFCAIQFAKGLRAYEGVYPAMFNDYASRNQGRYAYYNFEQDLGIVNFRKNKLSYQPERLLQKYRVRVVQGRESA